MRAAAGLAAAVLVALAATLATAAWAEDLTDTCIGVQVGERQSYDCLNAALARLTAGSHLPQLTATLGAASPAPAVGSFNQSATHERMGNAFGHSVVSQRPPRPVYVTPLRGPPP